MLKKILVACSGGPDSIALLNMYAKKHLVKAVVHINYNYRKSSKRDKEIVKKFCHQHHLKLYLKTINKKIYQTNKIRNFEAWARKKRYDFFLLISKLTNTKRILIAHHLDDFIETSIMQLRKNHFRNFYGIKQINYYKNLMIYRPLLKKIDKNEILNYCKIHQLKFGIDETNFDLNYERNYIRWILSKNINKKQEILHLINNLNTKLKTINNKINVLYKEWKKVFFSVEFFNNLIYQEQTYLIKKYLYLNHIKNLSWNKINNIIQFLKNNLNQKKIRISNNKFLIKTSKTLNNKKFHILYII